MAEKYFYMDNKILSCQIPWKYFYRNSGAFVLEKPEGMFPCKGQWHEQMIYMSAIASTQRVK